ncbi:MAG: hypothetical protein Q9208_004860, partial [Pyrenodesmia sp. 3 TL-2023]
MKEFCDLQDWAVFEAPRGVSHKATNFVESRRAVLTFRSVAAEAETNGQVEVAYEAHKKVLDYLTRSHILQAQKGIPVENVLPEHGQWWNDAVSAITRRASTDNNPDTSSTPGSTLGVQSSVGNRAASTAEMHQPPRVAPPIGTTGGSGNNTLGVASDGVMDEIAKVIASMEVQIKDNVPSWKDLVNVNGVKSQLQNALMHPLRSPHSYPGMKNGILLFGPPGCGKTTLVQSLVRACGCRLLDCTPSVIFSEWQGTISPCIIFIDEIESSVQDRGTESDSTSVSLTKSESMKARFSLKKSSVTVVGTTNHPEVIGYAFLRRFSTLLYIDPPDEAARLSLIVSALAKTSHSIDS